MTSQCERTRDRGPPPRRPPYVDYSIVDEGGDAIDLEWIGIAGGSHDERPRLFDPATEIAYKGSVDHDAEQIVVDPDTGRQMDVESIPSVVKHIGEWEWLSAYVRERLDDPETVETLL